MRNHFKRICIFILALLFGVVFLCPAQKKGPYKKRTPEEKARYFTKKMVDSLEVTADQEEALYTMNLVLSKKFDSVRTQSEALSRKERSLAYRAVYAYRDSCMRKILPRKEFLKFLDIERERWERKKARRKAKKEE